MPPSKRQRAQVTQGGAEVWLTDPAVEDLRRIDGAALVWALRMLLLLERDPNAGEPLLGALIGYRKLVVGNRDWRLVWRTTTDARGSLVVEIAEVWALGARSDAEVYAEMTRRVATLADAPVRRSLSDIIEQLGRRAKGLEAKAVATPRSAPEQWLVDQLVHTAGRDGAEVLAMTSEEAVDAWTAHVTRPR